MRRQLAGLALLGCLALAGEAWLGSCSPQGLEKYTEVDQEPRLSPDYTGTVIPANIAPLNFRILEEGQAYFVTVRAAPDPEGRDASGRRVGSDPGRPIHISSRTGRIRIPLRKWHALLAASRGRDILFDVYVRGTDRQWRRFRPIVNTVAQEDIDRTLIYRFLKPAYTWWHDMAIYERNLTSYDRSVVLQGRSFADGCLNCHSFSGNDPDIMSISLRSATYGSDTLLVRHGAVDRIGTKWGYTAWHPSGAVAVYSLNKVMQFFHAGGMEVRDVVDLDSALVCYRVESGKATCPNELADKSRLET